MTTGCPIGASWLEQQERAITCSDLEQLQAANLYLAAEIQTLQCQCPEFASEEDSAFCNIADAPPKRLSDVLADIDCGRLYGESQIWNMLARLAMHRRDCCTTNRLYS